MLVTGAYEKPVRVLSVVSPIEAVRCTENLRMLRKDKKREFLSPFKLAIKYATSVPKQFIRSILSLTLLVVVFWGFRLGLYYVIKLLNCQVYFIFTINFLYIF